MHKAYARPQGQRSFCTPRMFQRLFTRSLHQYAQTPRGTHCWMRSLQPREAELQLEPRPTTGHIALSSLWPLHFPAFGSGTLALIWKGVRKDIVGKKGPCGMYTNQGDDSVTVHTLISPYRSQHLGLGMPTCPGAAGRRCTCRSNARVEWPDSTILSWAFKLQKLDLKIKRYRMPRGDQLGNSRFRTYKTDGEIVAYTREPL